MTAMTTYSVLLVLLSGFVLAVLLVVAGLADMFRGEIKRTPPEALVAVGCMLAVLLLALLAGCQSGGSGDSGDACNVNVGQNQPQILEGPPLSSSFIVLCGDGTIIECPDASCAFGTSNGGIGSGPIQPNSGNTSDSGNTDNRDQSSDVTNPPPTPSG
jgi:hypothetical protein